MSHVIMIYEANACSNTCIAVRRRRRRQGFGPSTAGGGRVGAAQIELYDNLFGVS